MKIKREKSESENSKNKVKIYGNYLPPAKWSPFSGAYLVIETKSENKKVKVKKKKKWKQ